MEQKTGIKIAVPRKYSSNFWRSLEMPLINCKVELSLRWIENCMLTSAPIGNNADETGVDSATFKITDAKRYVPIVTLSAEDNAKLSKLLGISKNYRLIAADLSKQKALDADSRATQQIIFNGKIKATKKNTSAIIYYILEQSKERML